ncbi:tRNA (adenine(22)-N(1))-methyltransferase TrmK [Saccharibacillus sp. CPCC 101409]|uniref:tRNA (adenine(22)-N(1))-methyltransferase n=1 Tax=Saccharibacillus sp. CPCC 101409 TaxID=3058041 RepID=UPI0026733C66|nr:tRNA (adenine(22)-N(1))-methyltransferase TrmK [Saccharibacillus sp. CPCC 101409]MDO3409183.1 tRNA (adenine(22)-N(1))-methyltransferase TrmK [Saccharibacillus sp. CPCC 101409]
MKLSVRLNTICDRIPAGSRLADIGSDHALLPTYAVLEGKADFAVAGEVNRGPFDAASKQVAETGLGQKVSVRLGDGLAAIEAGEVDVITIAGMGGALIVRILTEGREKLEGVRRLILQPNVGEDIVRRWLLAEGWVLTGETVLEEDGKIYEVLTADRSERADKANAELYADTPVGEPPVTLSRDQLLDFGPFLVREASPVFRLKWESEIAKLERVAGSMGRSDSGDAVEKKAALERRIEWIKEVLACLPKDKPSSN